MKKTTFIFLLTGILILTCTYAARVYGASIPPDRQDLIPGIDVSQWQGYIDFNRVSQNGVEIVYIRAGEGASYTDPFFERNYAGAKTAGLKVGALLLCHCTEFIPGPPSGPRFCQPALRQNF